VTYERVCVLVAVVLAFAITATMDAHGLTEFSALPLLPLAGLLWLFLRFSRREAGLTMGDRRGYLAAVAFPAVILTIDCAIAVSAGATHPRALTQTSVVHALVGAIAGAPVVLLTEEGFFRGCLWAGLRRIGFAGGATLGVTSALFALWHLSYATLAAGYVQPPVQVAVFITNAFVFGVIWGTMRSISGSIVVSSVSHSVWNAFAYLLFGEGPKVGLLGITQTAIFGAEVGVLGLTLNALFALALLIAIRRRRQSSREV
jgi:uncharacterized protein